MRYAPVSLLLVVLAAVGGRAGDQARSAPAIPAAIEQTTRVEGTVPDLAGRWLVVAEVTVPEGGGTVVPMPQLWEVGTTNGTTTLALRSAQLPKPLVDAVTEANMQRRPWEPSVADLQRLRADWDRLAPDDRGLASVETVVIGRDAFPEATRADERMRDARFVIQQTLNYRPAPGRPMRDALLHGVMETTSLGYRGNYSSLGVAAAMVPVTIPFSGTFRMYRLESVPSPGLLARLFDVVAGCGRRPG